MACGAPSGNAVDIEDPDTGGDTGRTGETGGAGASNDTAQSDTSPPPPDINECYPEGEHPIARGIADEYTSMTSYDKVMAWFCDGALFEDILNALTTEELTGVEAQVTLEMLSTGKTWDEIWLELGVTEE